MKENFEPAILWTLTYNEKIFHIYYLILYEILMKNSYSIGIHIQFNFVGSILFGTFPTIVSAYFRASSVELY